MERKTPLRWQLQDLLHAAGEEGITQSDYGEHTGDVLNAKIEPIESFLRETTSVLGVPSQTGLPPWLSEDSKKYIFRAIKKQCGPRGITP